MKQKEFLIVGAGAIGSIIAGHLAKAGYPVSVLARGARAENIQKHGIRIRGLADFDVPVKVYTNANDIQQVNVLIIATKTPGTESLLQTLSHIKIDCAFSIQNGLMKNVLLEQAFSSQKILGSLANTSGELLPSGEVNFTRNVNLILGESSGGLSERVENIVDSIHGSGVNALAVDDIMSLEWSKFVSWVPLMLLSITTRLETWKYLSEAHSAQLAYRLVKEVYAILDAQSLTLIDDGSLLPLRTIVTEPEDKAIAAIISSGEKYKELAPEHRMSALQDLMAGRNLELHETIGYAMSVAKKLNLDTPLLDALFPLALAINETNGRQQ